MGKTKSLDVGAQQHKATQVEYEADIITVL